MENPTPDAEEQPLEDPDELNKSMENPNPTPDAEEQPLENTDELKETDKVEKIKLGLRTPNKVSRWAKYKQKHNYSPKLKKYNYPHPSPCGKIENPRENTSLPGINQDTPDAGDLRGGGDPIQDEAPPYSKKSQVEPEVEIPHPPDEQLPQKPEKIAMNISTPSPAQGPARKGTPGGQGDMMNKFLTVRKTPQPMPIFTPKKPKGGIDAFLKKNIPRNNHPNQGPSKSKNNTIDIKLKTTKVTEDVTKQGLEDEDTKPKNVQKVPDVAEKPKFSILQFFKKIQVSDDQVPPLATAEQNFTTKRKYPSNRICFKNNFKKNESNGGVQEGSEVDNEQD